MTQKGFYCVAVQWLRDERRLSTEVVPHERIADPTEAMRVPGFFSLPSRAATFAFTGLWVVTGGLVLSMLGMSGVAASTRELAHQVGYFAMAGGGGLLLAAYLTARRHRDRALVAVHPATAGPVSAASLHELHRDANGAILWLVTEQVPERAVLEVAATLGVRCFVPDQRAFRELPRASLEPAARS